MGTKIRKYLTTWTPDRFFRENAKCTYDRQYELRNVHDILSLSCCYCRLGFCRSVKYFFNTFWCRDSTARNGFRLSLFFFTETLGALRWVHSTFILSYFIFYYTSIYFFPSWELLYLFLLIFFSNFERWSVCDYVVMWLLMFLMILFSYFYLFTTLNFLVLLLTFSKFYDLHSFYFVAISFLHSFYYTDIWSDDCSHDDVIVSTLHENLNKFCPSIFSRLTNKISFSVTYYFTHTIWLNLLFK